MTKSSPTARLILADNVNALMSDKYRQSGNKPLALAKDAKISLSSVQRILACESSASADTIDKLAKALDLMSYQLLIPSLSPRYPQTI